MTPSHESLVTSHGGPPATAKIFVAGHRGLVGSAIVRRLEKDGFGNFILRSSRELDLRNQQAVDVFFEKEKPEYVFLAAAKVGGIYANNSYAADFIRDNLQIQTNVIDASRRNGVTKLVFLGSSCIYPRQAPQPIKENSLLTGPLEATNQWYAIAKIAGIKMCQAYRRQYGFNAICLMPTNMYGPNDNYDLENSHVLPALIRKFHLAKLAAQGHIADIERDEARFGRIPDEVLGSLGMERATAASHKLRITSHSPKVALWGSGTPRREFLHVDDLADACLFLMENYDSEEIINVGVGEDSTVRELAELVRKVVGFEGEIAWDDSKPDGPPRKLMDVSRLHKMGWQASIKLIDGIRRTYASYAERNR